jgi:hypothetical protein
MLRKNYIFFKDFVYVFLYFLGFCVFRFRYLFYFKKKDKKNDDSKKIFLQKKTRVYFFKKKIKRANLI